jgi:hypothetical protein
MRRHRTGGAEALRGIETLELRLQGETWPRLQMPTPTPRSGRNARRALVLD